MNKIVPKYSSYMWGGHFMYLGSFNDVMEHAHHALQIVFNRSGRIGFRMDESSIECGGVIVGADQRHQLLSSDDFQVHIWIDKEAKEAKMISAQQLKKDKIKILDEPLLKRLKACINTDGNFLESRDHARDVYRKIVLELGGDSGASEEPLDPRIVSTLQLLRKKYLSEKLSIAEIARNVCLSESRLIHLFTEQVGTPIRKYVLWMRLLTAMQMSAQGKQSLTEAAHSAGFSDSAHFSRTYRAMFGGTPSGGCSASQYVRIHPCF